MRVRACVYVSRNRFFFCTSLFFLLENVSMPGDVNESFRGMKPTTRLLASLSREIL